MGRSNREAVQAKVAEYGVDIPVLMDDAKVISKALGIDKTGEVFLFNPKSFVVEYRGPVAAAEQALSQLLAGETVSNAVVASTGSAVTYPVAAMLDQSPVSYEKDIAPIISENCATCHRAGGIAPFAMDSPAMVQGWSPVIREVLMTKRMPPGQIDNEYVNKFHDVEDAELQKVVHGIEAGAVQDGVTDPLTELA